ncbi:hypothetical protein C1X64_10975 [Pseudomonas sp. GW456-E7]|nr:hypothetical protein C1X64_10975 [Pseudomonas sp. GW456-E7]
MLFGLKRFWKKETGRKPLAHGVELANSRSGHDAAKSSREDDDLDRWPVAHSMHRAIRTTPPGFSTRIGLYGEWGAGKTSVLNFLREIALEQGDVVVHVSAWRALDADSFMGTLSEEMSAEIKKRRIKTPQKMTLKRWVASIASGITGLSDMTGQAAGKVDNDLATMVSMGAALTGSVVNTIKKRLNLSPLELEQLRSLLKSHHVIVFIDDLDRADPAILPKTLMTLREYLDWPGFAFVLAFDKEIIVRSLDEYSGAFSSSRQPFLDKIIDLEFELKPLSRDLTARLAERAMAQCCDFIPEGVRISSAQWFPDNPRQVRGIARELGSLREVAMRHGEGELKWEAIILQTLLRCEVAECVDIVEKELIGKGKPTLGTSFDSERKKEVSEILERVTEASGYEKGSPAFIRLYRLVVKLQGLRVWQAPELIDYEMQLGTHAPCFTQQELGRLIEQWNICIDDQLVVYALQTAAQGAMTDLSDASLRLLNMTLDQYSICTRLISEHKVRAQRELSLARAIRIVRFLCKLVQLEKVEALGFASGHIQICSRMLDMFVALSVRSNQGDEKQLRDMEHQILESVAQRCQDKAGLFHLCFRHNRNTEIPVLAEIVQELTAAAAVADVLGLLTEANGIYLCQLDEASNHRLNLLHDARSVLYTREHKAKLLQVLTYAESAEMRSILAKNSKDYLRLLIDRMPNFGNFCIGQLDVLQACWEAVTREQWLSSGIEEANYLRARLKSYGLEMKDFAELYTAEA